MSDDARGLAEPMRSRWSPALFDPRRAVPDDDLRLMLLAASWAPTYGNTQPASFVAVRSTDDDHPALLATLTRGNRDWVATAPLVLVAATLVGETEGRSGTPYADYDLGQCIAHLTLQAQATGWHAHQFAGFDHDAAARALGVPDAHRVRVGIAIGRPADDAQVAAAAERDRGRHRKERVRRALDEQAFGGRWGAPLG